MPKQLSNNGIRDVPGATPDTWFQYGRNQALSAFINTPKLIVGVLSKEPMYAYDDNDMLIASGGTAGYVAIASKQGSPYALEYIQAWLSNPFTERVIRTAASDFEGGFAARGSYLLEKLPFVPLDLSNNDCRNIYGSVIAKSKRIREINVSLLKRTTKRLRTILEREKGTLISEIEGLINNVYGLRTRP